MLEVIGEATDTMDYSDELETPAPESTLFREPEMEWFISPEQFVDFWIAAIFLLVGTWQIITILFLMTD